jgi:sec-independent protein translocase protein TatA
MNLFILLGIVGPWQIVLILAVVLLLFGGKKIPELMKGLGQGANEFKKGLNGDDEAKKKEESKKE